MGRERISKLAKNFWVQRAVALAALTPAIVFGVKEIKANHNPYHSLPIQTPFGEYIPPLPLPPVQIEPTTTPEAPPLPPRFIKRGDINRPEIAFTFDGGAGSTYTPTILDILKEKDVKVTMFLAGAWMERNPNLVLRMLEDGHQISNHSWDHLSRFTELSDEQIRWQLRKTEEKALEFGISTKPNFRPPFGSYDDRVIRIVAEEGYTQFVYWSDDSGDWIDDLPPHRVFSRVVTNVSNGAIFVMHLNSWQEPQVLGGIIDTVREKGFTLTAVPDLLREE